MGAIRGPVHPGRVALALCAGPRRSVVALQLSGRAHLRRLLTTEKALRVREGLSGKLGGLDGDERDLAVMRAARLLALVREHQPSGVAALFLAGRAVIRRGGGAGGEAR